MDPFQPLIATFSPEQYQLFLAAMAQQQAAAQLLQPNANMEVEPEPVIDISTHENIVNLIHVLLRNGKSYDNTAEHDGLKAHQIEGICFLVRHVIGALDNGHVVKGSGSGAILAHNMGLGKSFTVIAFIHTVLQHFSDTITKVLIISPKNVTEHWKNEFPKFTITRNHRIAEDIQITNFEDAGPYLRYSNISEWHRTKGKKHVLIMSYDMFKKMAGSPELQPFLVDTGPHLVIFDEAHKLKNKATQNYKMAIQIATPRKIFLTGTPLQNNPMELFQMIDFIHNGLLGAEKEFKLNFADPIEAGRASDAPAVVVNVMRNRCRILYEKLVDYIHRKDVKTLYNEVKKVKTEVTLMIRPTEIQRNIIEDYLERIDPLTNEKPKRYVFADRLHITYALNHPSIFYNYHLQNPDPSVNQAASFFNINSLFNIFLSNKLILLIEIIKYCESVGDKLIVFSQSLETLNYIGEMLQRMHQHNLWDNRSINCPPNQTWGWEDGRDFMRIDGSTSGRYDIQNAFQKTPQIRLMLMSTVASSLGTNFVAANRVVIFDSAWNPVDDIQAIYRTYRIGQDKDVFVYRLITKGTMEEIIYNRQITKEALARRIIDDEDIENQFRGDELNNLYRYERCPYDPTKEIETPFMDELVAILVRDHPHIIAELKSHDSFFDDRDDFFDV